MGSVTDRYFLYGTLGLAARPLVYCWSYLPDNTIFFHSDLIFGFMHNRLGSLKVKIVFFDGYCSLCNNSVDWLMRIDKKGKLKFASLQGDTAKQFLGINRNLSDLDSVIYLNENKRFERSSAVLNILADIGGPLAIFQIFLIVPQFIRDFVYKLVARNRYRIFGKRDTCRLPSPEERERLLP